MLANIIDFLKNKKITLFYFNIYELESNLLAHFFIKHNIKFYKLHQPPLWGLIIKIF